MGILLVGGLAAPDASPITMMLIAGPMYVLYEASIWIILLLEKSWHREANGL
jgi:Sec-independent protein secretion pathway component TatC